jgi:hypothetical protein
LGGEAVGAVQAVFVEAVALPGAGGTRKRGREKGVAKKGSGRFLLVLLPGLRGVAAEVEGG